MPKIKKSIVFCHGIWADGSCFNKVIPALQAEGHEVMAAQYGLDTPEGDVATVKRTLGRISSPAILVGHSNGGSVITAAGTDDFPPNSRVMRFIVAAPSRMMLSPTPTEPVNEIFATSGLRTSSAPTTVPRPVTTFKTPFGSPASCRASTKTRVCSELNCLDLITTVH